MALVSTPAILLRAVSYGEADRIVTLLGRDTGPVTALARGARKSQRRFSGGLGLGAIGEAVLRERVGADLLTLERFDLRTSYASFGTDLARMAHAGYAVELVGKLCAPRHAEPRVFELLERFFGALDARGASAERLRIFELGLLQKLGFAPALEGCAVCGATEGEGFRWDADRGGAVCAACARRGRPLGSPARAAMVALGRSRIDDEPAPLPPDVNRECREALLEIIKLHVTGPLHSVEFIAKLGGRV